MSALLVPLKYASLDIDTIQPIIVSNGQKYYLTVPQKHWYRVYELPNMKITLDSIPFDHQISSIGQHDTYVYVAVDNIIYTMNHYLCVGKTVLNHPEINCKVAQMLIIYPIFAASIENYLYLGLCGGEAEQIPLRWQIKGIIHPPTYLNKIVVITTHDIIILNVITKKLIVQINIQDIFERNKIQYAENEFKLIESSPALDIVAITTESEDGKTYIMLINLQNFNVIQKYDIPSTVKSIGFNNHGKTPLIGFVTSSQVHLIDLNKKSIYQTYTREYNVDWIKFLPNTSTFLIGSQESNSITEISYDQDQPLNQIIVRERSGFQGKIQGLKFIGYEDDPLNAVNMIGYSDCSQSEIRFISMINENMGQKFSLKQNKQNIKKIKNIYLKIYRTKNFDSQIEANDSEITQVNSLSFSVNRQHDWSNILTSHQDLKRPYFWNSENKTVIKQQANIHQNAEEKSSFQNGRIISTFVTNCGNFGILSLNDGRLVKITMQSGSHIKTIKMNSLVNHIYVDSQNQFLVAAQENNQIILMDFYNGKTLSTQKYDFKTTGLVGSKTSSIFMTAHKDGTILIWDLFQFIIIRRYKADSEIIACQFTSDNNYIISSSSDSCLQIWNLITGTLVQTIKLIKKLVTIDISFDGSVVVGAFQDSRTISVFNSLLNDSSAIARAQKNVEISFSNEIKLQSKDIRAQVYSITQKIEEEVPVYTEYDLELECSNTQLLAFTVLEDGLWVPILHLDQIRERNKIKISQEDVKIPFFLDFRSIDQQKQNLLAEIKENVKEQTKVLKKQKDKFLEELQSKFESLLTKRKYKTLFSYLKKINPSQYDYELRSAFLGKPENIARMFEFSAEILQSTNDLDLKITYIYRFLQVSLDDGALNYDEQMKQNIESIQNSLKQNWWKLQDQQEQVDAVIDFLKLRVKLRI